MIFTKCRDIPECRIFSQNAEILHFNKNFSFLISISLSLCYLNRKILTFATVTKLRMLGYLLAQYVSVTLS